MCMHASQSAEFYYSQLTVHVFPLCFENGKQYLMSKAFLKTMIACDNSVMQMVHGRPLPATLQV